MSREFSALVKYAAKRLINSAVVVLIASFILFWGLRTAFDPLQQLRLNSDPGVVQRQSEALGLTKPIPEQYLIWLRKFISGDWGVSAASQQEVFPTIMTALGTTVQLIFWGLVLSIFLAALVGIYSAVRPYSAADFVLTALSYTGMAIPAFWLGLVLIQFLSVLPQAHLGLADPPLYFVGMHSADESGFGLDYLRHLVLPVLALSGALVGSWSRYLRSSMLEQLNQDYVRTARAKGISRRRVIFHHALRNSLGPFVTVIALDAGLLFGGLVVTEQVFSINGMGRLFITSLQDGDVFVLVPWMVVFACAVMAFNLIADLMYSKLDPRVRSY